MVQNIWLDPHTIRPRRSNQKLAKPTDMTKVDTPGWKNKTTRMILTIWLDQSKLNDQHPIWLDQKVLNPSTSNHKSVILTNQNARSFSHMVFSVTHPPPILLVTWVQAKTRAGAVATFWRWFVCVLWVFACSHTHLVWCIWLDEFLVIYVCVFVVCCVFGTF